MKMQICIIQKAILASTNTRKKARNSNHFSSFNHTWSFFHYPYRKTKENGIAVD